MMKGKGEPGALRKRLLMRWVATYLVVVLLIVCIVAVVSAVALRAISASARGEQREKMQHVRLSVDAALSEIENTLVQLSADEYLQALSMRPLPYTPSQLSMLYTLNQRLRQSMAAHRTWMGAYVYFHLGAYILEDGAKHTLDAVYPKKDFAISQAEWVRRMDQLGTRAYVRLASAKDPSRFYVECWWPMVGQSADDPLGILAVRLNAQNITSMLIGMKWYRDELVVVLDAQGQPLFSSDPVTGAALETLQAALSARAEGTAVIEVGSSSVGLADSQINDWVYASVLAADFLVSGPGPSYTGRMAQALCVILLVSGVLLSIVAARMRLKPVSRLYDLAKQTNPPGKDDEGQDAYRYLEHSMRAMLDNYQDAQRQLLAQNRLVRNHVLIRLLTGNMHSIASFDDVCFSNGICFISDRFLVVTFSVLNEGDVFFGDHGAQDAGQVSGFIVLNVFEELLDEVFNAFVIEYDSLIVGILNLKEHKQGGMAARAVREIYQRGQGLIQSHFGLLVTCQLSEECQGLSGVAKAYDQTMEILEYQQLIDSRQPGFTQYSDIAAEKEAPGYTSFNIESHIRLVQLIKSGDFRQAKALIIDTVDKSLADGPQSAEAARCLLFSLMNALLDAMHEISGTFDEAILEAVHPIDRLLHCASIAALRKETCRILDEIGAYMDSHKQDPHDQIVEHVKARVATGLSADLSVSGLADELNLSVSALSRLFKKRTQQGLLSYINEMRLEKAKALLLQTDLTLSEIAEETGLINSGTLIRIFKRYLGITPGKYKQTMLAKTRHGR